MFNDPNVPKLSVSHIVNHPSYFDFHHDISLIRLEKPVELTDDIKLICLPNGIPDREIKKSYSYCILSGLGHIARGVELIFLQ